MSTAHACEIEQGGFAYQGGPFVLRGLDLSVAPGEFVCLMGANGSGKTTIAHAIDALLLPREGVVLVDGKRTDEPDNVGDIRCFTGLVFQNPNEQLVSTVVEDEIAFGPENLGWSQERIRQAVDAALRCAGATELTQRAVGSLSGGERQRVALAGVLAMQPSLLVLDEPFSMLDVAAAEELLGVVRSLNDEGMTVLMVTHDPRYAQMSQRVVVVADGRIALDGTPAAVLNRVEELHGWGLRGSFAAELLCELRRADLRAHADLQTEGDLRESDAARSEASCGSGPCNAITLDELEARLCALSLSR